MPQGFLPADAMKPFFLTLAILTALAFPLVVHADISIIDALKLQNSTGTTTTNTNSLSSQPGTAFTIDRVFRIIESAVNIFFAICMLIAVSYAVYGGFMIATAGGDAARAATGRKTMTNAFIGIALILGVGVIVNSIAFAVSNPESFL